MAFVLRAISGMERSQSDHGVALGASMHPSRHSSLYVSVVRKGGSAAMADEQRYVSELRDRQSMRWGQTVLGSKEFGLPSLCQLQIYSEENL